MFLKRYLLVVSIGLIVVPGAGDIAGAKEAAYSKLWGKEGQLWSGSSRLPDFSYAGYRRGEAPLPEPAGEISVKDFGAVGDGQADDTEAFKKAISKSRGQAVFVPAGKYRITDFLYIRRSGVSLVGEGPRKSVLYFPVPLEKIKSNMGATTGGRPTSNYSWSGGFVYVRGSHASKVLATVRADARRGQRKLRVSDAGKFEVGQDYRLVMRDTKEQNLAAHLYAGDPGAMKNFGSRAAEAFVFRVTKIDQADGRIVFDRPLRTDVRLEWEPRFYEARCSVEEVGIENLGFEFPVTPYKGHFTELGYNAIAMRGVRNCWVRNVLIHNSDSGMFISGNNITIRGVEITSERARERQRKATGHHGITLGGQDNLLEDFEFKTRFMHDITVTSGSAGNVAAGGCGVDMCLDHHRRAPHANLFTDIDLGEGSRMFQSGGGAALGRHCGAWETFWCIRAERGQKWPGGWGPDMMNFVGVEAAQDSVTDMDGKWFEAIDPARIEPRNLYKAQLERRLGGLR